jgi:hypothetical protein
MISSRVGIGIPLARQIKSSGRGGILTDRPNLKVGFFLATHSKHDTHVRTTRAHPSRSFPLISSRVGIGIPLARQIKSSGRGGIQCSDQLISSLLMSGWAPGEDYVAQVAVETTVKKPTKTKGSGLGKAWRKGIKK